MSISSKADDVCQIYGCYRARDGESSITAAVDDDVVLVEVCEYHKAFFLMTPASDYAIGYAYTGEVEVRPVAASPYIPPVAPPVSGGSAGGSGLLFDVDWTTPALWVRISDMSVVFDPGTEPQLTVVPQEDGSFKVNIDEGFDMASDLVAVYQQMEDTSPNRKALIGERVVVSAFDAITENRYAQVAAIEGDGVTWQPPQGMATTNGIPYFVPYELAANSYFMVMMFNSDTNMPEGGSFSLSMIQLGP